MTETILIVDDDVNLLAALKRQLRGRFVIETAQSGEEALFMMTTKGQPAVILADLRMGGMNGVETLKKVREIAPDVVRLMLTGNADLQTAIDAINDGNIFRFLTKPCAPEMLEAGLSAALDQYRLITAERELLEKTLAGSVKVLTDLLAMASPEGFGRANRIRDWVRKLTATINMPCRWPLELAAMLAPLGLLALPNELLAKVHNHLPLSDIEQKMVERCPEAARNVIVNIPRLGPVAQIVFLQNRGYDGSGFPKIGPIGSDIPLDARIIKILNDLSAICDTPNPLREHFLKLEEHIGRYDSTLFKKIWACLETKPQEENKEIPIIVLPTELLLPGQTLAADVVAEGGRLILAAMVQLSESHVERLRNLANLKYIENKVKIFDFKDM